MLRFVNDSPRAEPRRSWRVSTYVFSDGSGKKERPMYRVMLFSVLLALTAAAVAQNNQPLPSGAVNAYPSEPTISSNGPVVEGFGAIPKTGDATEIKIAKRVRHELLMLPYYSLFDDLEYTVQGRTVTLSGYVTSYHSLTKQSAEKTVRKIEGVEKVVNNIQVL